MNLDQTFSILFRLRRSKKTSDGLIPIYVRITIDGERAEVSARKKILEKHWDALTCRANEQCENAKVLNEYFNSLATEITRRYYILQAAKDNVTAEDVKNSLRKKKNVETPPPLPLKTFLDNFEDFLDFHQARMKVDTLSEGRFSHMRTLKTKCVDFMSQVYKCEDLVLETVRLGYIAQFQNHLLTVGKIAHNTSMKYAKDLKQVMDFAITMGHIKLNPFDSFKITLKKVKRTYLTQTELKALMKVELRTARLQEVRDVFVFCCFTGYAFSDVYALTPMNVTYGIDGNKWIIHDRFKSDNPENVPLLPVALQIVEKYELHSYCTINNKLLPVNSNQRYNEYLKEIAALAGIEKNLTTHVARHTFATTVCLTNGVPIETVQKLLAHGDLRTTQIYAQVVPIKVSSDMNELKKRLIQHDPELMPLPLPLKQANA